jgi:CO/xanthine dehydrogenase FAD-binding subunit
MFNSQAKSRRPRKVRSRDTVAESVQIPVDLLAETRAALDAALSGSADAPVKVKAARAKLDAHLTDNSDRMSADKKQAGYHLLRRIDELKREIKKDYGLEK